MTTHIIDLGGADEDSLNFVANRKGVYANGRTWIFYKRSAKFVFRSSGDGGYTWSGYSTIGSALDPAAQEAIDVCTDGTYVHCAYVTQTDLCYRRGLLNADGSIAWNAEQTVTAALAAPNPKISLTLDSAGYPCVAYNPTHVKCSSTKDGTWTNNAAKEFAPVGSNTNENVVLAALTSQRLFVIISDPTTVPGVCSYLFDGTSWNIHAEDISRRVPTTVGLYGETPISAVAKENNEISTAFINLVGGNYVAYSFNRSTSFPTSVASRLDLPFIEGSGNPQDYSGYGNNGTNSGAPIWVPGSVRYGLSFDGFFDYVTVAHSASLDGIFSALTLRVRFQLGQLNRGQAIYWKQTDINNELVLWVLADNTLNAQVGNGGPITGWGSFSVTSKAVLTTGVWYDAIVTYTATATGTTLKLYINNALDNQGFDQHQINAYVGTDNVYIADDSSHTLKLKGIVDTAQFYDQAFTQAQIDSFWGSKWTEEQVAASTDSNFVLPLGADVNEVFAVWLAGTSGGLGDLTLRKRTGNWLNYNCALAQNLSLTTLRALSCFNRNLGGNIGVFFVSGTTLQFVNVGLGSRVHKATAPHSGF